MGGSHLIFSSYNYGDLEDNTMQSCIDYPNNGNHWEPRPQDESMPAHNPFIGCGGFSHSVKWSGIQIKGAGDTYQPEFYVECFDGRDWNKVRPANKVDPLRPTVFKNIPSGMSPISSLKGQVLPWQFEQEELCHTVRIVPIYTTNTDS